MALESMLNNDKSFDSVKLENGRCEICNEQADENPYRLGEALQCSGCLIMLCNNHSYWSNENPILPYCESCFIKYFRSS